DGVLVAFAAGPPEADEALPQPAIEEALHLRAVLLLPDERDGDVLAVVLVAFLLRDDLPHHLAVRRPARFLVFAQLPEAAPVVEPLGDPQLEEARGPGDRLGRQLLLDPGLDRLADVLLVQLGDGGVVLGLL